MNTLELKKMANEVRKSIVSAVHSAKAGHPGGSLSAADIFTYLYFEELKYRSQESGQAGQGSFRIVQGTYGSRILRGACPQRIFPGGGSSDAPSSGILSPGPSLHAAYSRVDMSSGSLGQEFPRRSAWRSAASLTMRITGSILFSATVRSRKDRYGRLPCWQRTESWTTWW